MKAGLSKGFRLNRVHLFGVLGALINVTIQLSMFFDNWQTVHQHDTTVGEFFREFSWLMLIVTVLFFTLIGSLVQRGADEKAEAAEIAAELEARRKARPGRMERR